MGYVKSAVRPKPHCMNCFSRIKKCEYCGKNIENNKHVLCLETKSELYAILGTYGHCCSEKCYDEHKKHLELMKK